MPSDHRATYWKMVRCLPPHLSPRSMTFGLGVRRYSSEGLCPKRMRVHSNAKGLGSLSRHPMSGAGMRHLVKRCAVQFYMVFGIMGVPDPRTGLACTGRQGPSLCIAAPGSKKRAVARCCIFQVKVIPGLILQLAVVLLADARLLAEIEQQRHASSCPLQPFDRQPCREILLLLVTCHTGAGMKSGVTSKAFEQSCRASRLLTNDLDRPSDSTFEAQAP